MKRLAKGLNERDHITARAHAKQTHELAYLDGQSYTNKVVLVEVKGMLRRLEG